MDAPNIWDFNLDGMRRGSWWWWFWLFFWENPKNPDKPKQFMILWSTKNDPRILCNDLVIDNHFIRRKDGSCEFGGTVGAWHFDGEKMIDEYLLANSDITLADRPARSLVCGKPVKTVYSEPQDGTHRIVIGDDFEFTAKCAGDDFSKLRYNKGVFFKMFDYRMSRMSRLSLEVKEKKSKKTLLGTAYFQKVMVNAPVPPWHWGIFHFSHHTLTYYRPFIGSGVLSNNLFKKDPIRLNKGLKSSIKFHDHRSGLTHIFTDITVKTRTQAGGLPIFHVSSESRSAGSIRFTVEPYAESVWRFKKRIADRLFHSNVHYQEYPSKINDFLLELPDGTKITSVDVGVGVGNAEDNAGFLL
jgi:hypothetical protein